MMDKRIHLRLWSNNSRDVETACGLFSRTNYNDVQWTNDEGHVTCPKCVKARELLEKEAE